MTKPPQKHHYLPQFYLREFAVDRKSLFQIVKKTSKIIGGRVNKMAAINDFHTLDGYGASDAYLLEKRLSVLEGRQAAMLRTVLAGGLTGSKQYRKEVVEFIALMRMRVPVVKRHISQSYGSMIRSTATLLERTGKLPKLELPDGKILDVDKVQIKVMNWKVMDQMFRTGTSPSVLSTMHPLRLTIFRAPFGEVFITSDQPVSLFHPFASGTRYGVGPSTAGTEVCLPLSSRMLVRLDHGEGKDLDVVATSAEILEFNRRTIVSADTFVFAGESPERFSSIMKPLALLSSGFVFDEDHDRGGVTMAHRYLPVGPACC